MKLILTFLTMFFLVGLIGCAEESRVGYGDSDTDTDSDGDTDTDSDSDSDSDTDTDADGDDCAYQCSAHCGSIGGTVMTGTCSQTGYKCCDLGGVSGDTDTDADTDGDTDTDADTDSDSDNTSNTGTPLPKFVGNITTSYSHAVDYDGLRFADYWNQITPENAGKWGSVEGSMGGANWAPLEAIYSYCEDNDIIFKQHAFIWGSQEPANAGSKTEADVKNWMNTFCEKFPNTKLIDVVNEPPPHTTPSYANNIGGGTNSTWTWIINAFKWAREACPNAILILNDYNNIEWPNDNQQTISIANTLIDAGAPIDAIGAQSHDLDHGSVQPAAVKSLIAKIHDETGLPVYITELDISTSDDNAQLSKFQEYLPFFLETEYIHGITIWGWIYGQTWSMASESGLVRNGKSRSAMTWLMNELGRPAP